MSTPEDFMPEDFRVTRFDEDAILRIAIRTPVRVRDIAKALNALEIAYSKTYVLYDRMARLSQLARLTETEEIIRQFSRMSEMLHLRIPAPYPGWEQIPREYELQLVRIRAESPGFADLKGAGGPLETLRRMWNDRDERRKDRDWREALEREAMELTNRKTRAEVGSAETDREKANLELLNELVQFNATTGDVVDAVRKAQKELETIEMGDRLRLMPPDEADGTEPDDGDDDGSEERGGGGPGDEGRGGGDDDEPSPPSSGTDGDAEEPEGDDIADDEIIDAYAPGRDDRLPVNV
jgi:hypothetical protein